MTFTPNHSSDVHVLKIYIWALGMTRRTVCQNVVCLCVLQHYYFYNHRSEPLVYLTVYGFVMTMFSIGLAIGVIIAVGMLFYIQVRCQMHDVPPSQLER